MKRFILLLPILLFALGVSAQTISENDGSLCVTSHRFSRIGESLVLSMQVSVNRQVKTNEQIVLIPELVDGTGNYISFPSIYINGRNQQIVFERETARKVKVGKAIKRDNKHAQDFDYLQSVPYQKWMSNAEFTLVEQDCGCGVPVGTGPFYSSRLNLDEAIRPELAFIKPMVEEVKLREEKGCAYLDFPVNVTKIIPDYHSNPKELAKIKNSIDLVKNDPNVTISGISLHGYASPEGPYANNVRLAQGRVEALRQYVCSQYTFPESLFRIESTPEDWGGFERRLRDTVMTNRDKILNIVLSKDDPDTKERKLRRGYPKEYEYILENWFPYLRHSDYVVQYVVRAFTSVEQAKEEFEKRPKNLSIEEMFRIAQTYPVGSAEYNRVFMTAVLLNPENPVANHNAACIMLMQGQVDMAAPYLQKAANSPEKTLAEGVFHLLKGDYSVAKQKLEEAQRAGVPEARKNLEILNQLSY